MQALNDFWNGWISNLNLNEKVCAERMLLANQFKLVCQLHVVSLASSDELNPWRNNILKEKEETDR